MKVAVISGSPRKTANTQIVMKHAFEYAKTKNEDTHFINLSEWQVEYYRGPDETYNEDTRKAVDVLLDADVWLIGTPIYNSFFSSAVKNLFEYVDYKKTEGKVAGMAIMAAGDIGFVDVQTMLTQLLSYFRVIANPKAVFLTVNDVKDGKISSDAARRRLDVLVDETLSLASKINQSQV